MIYKNPIIFINSNCGITPATLNCDLYSSKKDLNMIKYHNNKNLVNEKILLRAASERNNISSIGGIPEAWSTKISNKSKDSRLLYAYVNYGKDDENKPVNSLDFVGFDIKDKPEAIDVLKNKYGIENTDVIFIQNSAFRYAKFYKLFPSAARYNCKECLIKYDEDYIDFVDFLFREDDGKIALNSISDGISLQNTFATNPSLFEGMIKTINVRESLKYLVPFVLVPKKYGVYPVTYVWDKQFSKTLRGIVLLLNNEFKHSLVSFNGPSPYNPTESLRESAEESMRKSRFNYTEEEIKEVIDNIKGL